MSASSTTPQPHALLIEVADRQAGIAVRERGGFAFFAADPQFYVLDGSRFARIEQLQFAARRVGEQIRKAANVERNI